MPETPDATTPQYKVVRAQGTWKGRYRTDLSVRDFAFVTAEPEKLGGTNEGPTPMEYVIGALNGCLSVVIEMVAREMGFRLEGLEIRSEGLVDQRGLFGTADVSPHFQSVDIHAAFVTDEPPERLQALQAAVLKRCPVYNLIKDSGAEVRLHWEVRSGVNRG